MDGDPLKDIEILAVNRRNVHIIMSTSELVLISFKEDRPLD